MKVAPHTGAWIETMNLTDQLIQESVAPHTGAWIETKEKEYAQVLLDVAPHEKTEGT